MISSIIVRLLISPIYPYQFMHLWCCEVSAFLVALTTTSRAQGWGMHDPLVQRYHSADTLRWQIMMKAGMNFSSFWTYCQWVQVWLVQTTDLILYRFVTSSINRLFFSGSKSIYKISFYSCICVAQIAGYASTWFQPFPFGFKFDRNAERFMHPYVTPLLQFYSSDSIQVCFPFAYSSVRTRLFILKRTLILVLVSSVIPRLAEF